MRNEPGEEGGAKTPRPPRRSTKRSRGERPSRAPETPKRAGGARRGTARKQPPLPEEVVDEAAPMEPVVPVARDQGEETSPPPETFRGRAREARRLLRGNALGELIEYNFSERSAPVHSYSELERRSGISREALSRYVTTRPDRRRSPTVDMLARIADTMHLGLEQLCRAAAASARGASLPDDARQRVRADVVAPHLSALTDAQFAAIVELLRQMQPPAAPET